MQLKGDYFSFGVRKHHSGQAYRYQQGDSQHFTICSGLCVFFSLERAAETFCAIPVSYACDSGFLKRVGGISSLISAKTKKGSRKVSLVFIDLTSYILNFKCAGMCLADGAGFVSLLC
jgi:hypothetical protein